MFAWVRKLFRRGCDEVHIHHYTPIHVPSELSEMDRRAIRLRYGMELKRLYGQHGFPVAVFPELTPDQKLQRAARQFAKVVIDVLENG